MSSSSTSDLRPAGPLVEARRLRLERLLQTAAHDFELRLDFGQHDALGPGQIILATEGDRPAAAAYALLKGRALHLLGHYLHPEGREWAEAARREEAGGKPRFAALWHALEDARLENELIRRWPGAKRTLEALKLPNLGGALLRRMPLNAQVEYGLYFSGRGFRGARFRYPVKAALEEANELIRGAASGIGPGDSFQGMLEIYPLVAPLVSGRSPGGQERPSGQAQEIDGQTGETVEVPGREPPAGIPELEIEEGVVEVSLLGQRQEFPEWFQPGSAPWFERGLGEKKVHPSAVCSDRQTIVDPPKGDLEAYRALRAEIEREAGFLAHRLTNLIREETYLRSGGQYRSGQLNMARLWKQRTGNYRLFQRTVSGGSRVPAFSLLVDESASMKGQGKYRTATKAAILLGETLDLLGVPLEITGYTTAEYEARAALKLGLTPAYEYRATRCSRLEHRLYKRFDEPYAAVRARLAGIEPRRNNWDEESLLFAYARLGARPESRKILLVLSDGQPNGDADHLVQTVKRVESRGCKVIAIGIGADFVQQIYSDHIVVADFRQMAEELLEILRREFRYS